jgi:hypothetical protein
MKIIQQVVVKHMVDIHQLEVQVVFLNHHLPQPNKHNRIFKHQHIK